MRDVDQEQRLSKELLEAADTSPHVKAASVPEPMQSSFLFSPTLPTSFSQEDLSTDLSMSPAAMFLSSFSPAASAPTTLPDDEGEIVQGYILGPIVGYGAFSTIRRATSTKSPGGETVAVKIVRRGDIQKQDNPARARQHLDHERQVWSSLSHEHILPLFSSLHTPYADFFITLYCPAGSLFDILKRDGTPALPQDDVGMMFRQVVRGLRYLHEVAGIVHGDLKLENVLVDETGVCKIADFGMARKIGSDDELDADGSSNGGGGSSSVVCSSPADDDDVGNEDENISSNSDRRGNSDRHHLREEDPQYQQPRVRSLSHFVPRSSSRSKNRSRSRHASSALPLHLSKIKHQSGPRHRNSSPLPMTADTKNTSEPPPFQTGSLPYAAPELLLPPSSTAVANYPRPNPAQDIWALGVMLYALLTGRLPFSDPFEPRLQMKILHGVYEVPQGIGRGAERVLQGCIERSVPKRWTISMVDEVAWGVGWGASGDDVAEIPSPVQTHAPLHPHPPSPCEREVEKERSLSSSRSQERSGRSVSAVRSGRSASRNASHPYHPHPHSHTHPHHSHHAHHHTAPTFNALNDAILRSTSMSSTISSSDSSYPALSDSIASLSSLPPPEDHETFSEHDREFRTTPSRSRDREGASTRERGRPLIPHLRQPLQQLQSTSRSPSPPTPSDTFDDLQRLNALVERSRSRGRKASPRYLHDSPGGHPFLRRDFDLGNTASPSPSRLHTVEEYPSSSSPLAESSLGHDERSSWEGEPEEPPRSASSSRGGLYDRFRTPHDEMGLNHRDEFSSASSKPKTRPGSMPPVPSSSLPWRMTSDFSSDSGNAMNRSNDRDVDMLDTFVSSGTGPTGTMPKNIPGSSTRSRSVGIGVDVGERERRASHNRNVAGISSMMLG